jgi:Circadian oscillating protein COP23
MIAVLSDYYCRSLQIGTIYSNPTETALTRCNRVTSTLSSLNYLKQLSLIKLGEMNNKPTICISNRPESPCSKLIFTLEQNEKAANILKDLHIAMKGLPIKTRIIAIVEGNNNITTVFGRVMKGSSRTRNLPETRLPQVDVEEEIILNERNGMDLR